MHRTSARSTAEPPPRLPFSFAASAASEGALRARKTCHNAALRHGGRSTTSALGVSYSFAASAAQAADSRRAARGESRLQHLMRMRYYDPHAGRFMAEDPVPAGNLYPYVFNDPVDFVDPMGRYPGGGAGSGRKNRAKEHCPKPCSMDEISQELRRFDTAFYHWFRDERVCWGPVRGGLWLLTAGTQGASCGDIAIDLAIYLNSHVRSKKCCEAEDIQSSVAHWQTWVYCTTSNGDRIVGRKYDGYWQTILF